MKTQTARHIAAVLILPLVLGMTMGGKNLLRNGDFEKFTGDEPDGWTTTNIPKTLTIVSAVPGQHGKLAVRCDVKPFYGTQIAGMIIQKNISLSGPSAALMGSFTMNAIGGDIGYVTMEMRNAEGSSVRVCHENLTSTGGVWKTFNLSGSVPAEVVSAELRLTILSGKDDGSVHEGSTITFDDLVLTAGDDSKPGV